VDDVIRVPLGDLTDLADGEMRACRAGSFAVLVCRVGGALHAVEDECSHAETTLSDGMLDGYVVTCPLHFAQFDVRDGSHLCPPAFKGVASFPVSEDGDGATVEVPVSKRQDTGPGMPGGMFRTR
jgi:nitrite reductase/ring-hydroxylating ferredoxin subunit